MAEPQGFEITISCFPDAAFFARRLRDDLANVGYKVFINFDNSPGGDLWTEIIYEAIGKCKVFILLLSPDSARSDFPLTELQFAFQQNKKVYPVVNTPVKLSAELQSQLSRIDVINMDEENYLRVFTELLSDLDQMEVFSKENRDQRALIRGWNGAAGRDVTDRDVRTHSPDDQVIGPDDPMLSSLKFLPV